MPSGRLSSRSPALGASVDDGERRYDALVVGAGIGGVIFLKYARDAGLRCLALEKQEDVGGLWNRLPAWQDIQNRRQDFAIDGVPIDGVRAPDVVGHVRRWVDEHDLADSIRLGHEVTSVSWSDGRWRVRTNRGAFEAEYLVVASGAHSQPYIPPVRRSDPSVVELHSSQLRQTEDLSGRRVTVVGGGASAWDLLDAAIEHGAREIRWVYRSPRWFLPTRRGKHTLWPNIRELALVQSIASSTDTVNAFLRGLLRREYASYGLGELEPSEPFDVRTHMLIPGRPLMVRHLDRIIRHRTAMTGVEGSTVTLADGRSFPTDVVLWATGYRLRLDHLDLPEYREVSTVEELIPKLGSLVRSRDRPNMFFVGMTLVETTSATAFTVAVQAKSIVTHILGGCEIPEKVMPHQITHWDLLRHFASFDHVTYRPGWWRIEWGARACWYALRRNASITV